MTTVLEAYDWIRFLDQYGEKLSAALAGLEQRGEHDREKTWMKSALALIEEERVRGEPLFARLRDLPEMSAAREEHAAELVGPWVDLLEKLLAGITFHFGSRAPVIEALFPNQKLANLRRGNLDEVRTFWTEMQRRLASSYVERIFAQDDYAFARDIVEQMRTAFQAFEAVASPAPPSEKERALIVDDALAIGARAELAVAQARLIAEAALWPFEGAFASAGLSAKPKKRAVKVSESDVPAPVVEVESTPPVPEVAVEAAAESKPKKKRPKKSAEATPDASS